MSGMRMWEKWHKMQGKAQDACRQFNLSETRQVCTRMTGAGRLHAAMAQVPARHFAHRAHATSGSRTGAGEQRRVLAGVLHVLTCSVAKVSTHDSSSSSSSHSPNKVPADCRHSSIQDGLQEDVHGVLGANGTSTQLQENSRPAQRNQGTCAMASRTL
jgi:hypothetical protein